jgi:hypothetical protein
MFSSKCVRKTTTLMRNPNLFENLYWSHQSVDENLHDCKTSEVRWGYFDGIIALHFESCELRCKHHYQVLPLSVFSIHGDACRIRAKAESALKACMFATVASFETKFPRCWFANQHSSCYIAGDSSEVEDKRTYSRVYWREADLDR